MKWSQSADVSEFLSHKYMVASGSRLGRVWIDCGREAIWDYKGTECPGAG